MPKLYFAFARKEFHEDREDLNIAARTDRETLTPAQLARARRWFPAWVVTAMRVVFRM